jgi:hypothetical protein
MSKIVENGLVILRVLSELGAVGWEKLVPIQEIIPLTNLTKDEFNQACEFIKSQSYVKFGNIEGGGLMITGKGIEYQERALDRRYNLNLTAERILTKMVSGPPGKQYGMRDQLIDEMDLDVQAYEEACQQLEDYKLIKYVASTGELWGYIKPTDEGRLAVRRNFQDPQAVAAMVQTGPIFTGSISAQNFQAITNAINSHIDQTIIENDPELLETQASEIIKLLVDQASGELPLDKQAVYTQAASELVEEIEKPDRDLETIQKLMAVLSFLDKAVSVGDKTFELANKALPTILILTKMLQGLWS